MMHDANNTRRRRLNTRLVVAAQEELTAEHDGDKMKCLPHEPKRWADIDALTPGGGGDTL